MPAFLPPPPRKEVAGPAEDDNNEIDLDAEEEGAALTVALTVASPPIVQNSKRPRLGLSMPAPVAGVSEADLFVVDGGIVDEAELDIDDA